MDSQSQKSEKIDNCNGCGACCLHLGTPPGFAIWFPPPGAKPRDTAGIKRGNPDAKIVAKMPPEVVASLRAGFDEAWATGRSGQDFPCFWFDVKTRKCSHWEHRPTVCREFTVGGAACEEHRYSRGIRTVPLTISSTHNHSGTQRVEGEA